MSKVKIQGHASGTGVLTVTAPNTSTDRTITLPDTTGTLLDENSSVPAANLTGTIADARFPATLPAASAANLTAIPAANITGTLPAISGANLTNLPSGGKVLQVVQDTSTTQYSTNATSWQSTDLSVAITPSSTSSKILCILSTQTWINVQNVFCFMGIDRDGTNLGGQAWGLSVNHLAYQSGSSDDRNPAHITYLDSPNSTSSLTYSFKFKATYGTCKVMDSNMVSSLVLMEIGA